MFVVCSKSRSKCERKNEKKFQCRLQGQSYIGYHSFHVNTLDEIAEELWCPPSADKHWNKELAATASTIIEHKFESKSVHPTAESGKLYSEISQLQMGLECLKKSIVFPSILTYRRRCEKLLNG